MQSNRSSSGTSTSTTIHTGSNQPPHAWFGRNLNDDYPPEGTPIRQPDRNALGKPRIDACVVRDSSLVVSEQVYRAKIIVPIPTAAVEAASHAFWLERVIHTASNGPVLYYGTVLRRCTGTTRSEWELTKHRCVIKEFDKELVDGTQKPGNLDPFEDAIFELAAMQYLSAYQQKELPRNQQDDRTLLNGEEYFVQAQNHMHRTNVMMPLGVYCDSTKYYCVMPKANCGSLCDVMSTKKFTERKAQYWMHQILNGLETLQRAGICHRDFGPENLVVDSRTDTDIDIDIDIDIDTDCGKVLIIDMGMSIKIPYCHDDECFDHRQRARFLIQKGICMCGKPKFMSPEICKNKDPYDGHAVDIWALGPILYRMIVGEFPFEIPNNADEKFEFFSEGHFQQCAESSNLGLSKDLLDLLQKMFFVNPRDRLSLDQIRKHPWMERDIQGGVEGGVQGDIQKLPQSQEGGYVQDASPLQDQEAYMQDSEEPLSGLCCICASSCCHFCMSSMLGCLSGRAKKRRSKFLAVIQVQG